MSDRAYEEIDGLMYKLIGGDSDDGDGPSYHEVELKPTHPDGHYPAFWDSKDNAYVRCGKCKGDKFRVSSCSSNYESWAYCDCGNKFLLHTG